MEQKSLAKWLKAIILGVAMCGIIVYAIVIPMIGKELVLVDTANLSGYYLPWLLFIWGSGIPCYIALVFAWKVAGNIGVGKSFSNENASLLKKISYLAGFDAAYVFLGNLILFFMNMNHPSVLLSFLMVVFAGVAVSIASAALSYLVTKAAELQEQSDWTI